MEVIMNAAIKNALKKSPAIIVVDVELCEDWTICGEPAILFKRRGGHYVTPYTAAELRAKLAIYGTHEGWVAEGHAYRHQYHVADNVPADIAAALRAN
jgi:hypothetical protein